MSRLKEQYQNEIVDAMIKKFGYKNIMEVPKLDKVVINMGVGEAKENAKVLESAIADMEKIAGQKRSRLLRERAESHHRAWTQQLHDARPGYRCLLVSGQGDGCPGHSRQGGP